MFLGSASSSDDDSDDDSEDEQPPIIRSMEDLPSDDSVVLDIESESEGSDSNDSEDSDSSDSEGFSVRAENKFDDLTLEERIKQQSDEGISTIVRGNRRERKAAALQKAKERLKAASSSKKEKRESKHAEEKRESKHAKEKRKSKHAPTELSSTRKDFFERGAPVLNNSGIGITLQRYKSRDPRMSSMSGRFNEDHFEHHYQFLDEMREKEIETLQQRIKARGMTGERGKRLRKKLEAKATAPSSLEEDQEELTRLKQEQSNNARNNLERNAKRTVKRKIRDQVEAGEQGAFFLKRKEMKRLKFEAKYDELKKKDGAVEKALAKRRQKNKSKDSRLMV